MAHEHDFNCLKEVNGRLVCDKAPITGPGTPQDQWSRSGLTTEYKAHQALEKRLMKERRAHPGSTTSLDALTTQLLGDPAYVELHKFPKWNIRPTVLQEPRLMGRLRHFLVGKTAHLARAEFFAQKARDYKKRWHAEVALADKKYGEHGSLISGGFHDHWPEAVKNRIRYFAQATTTLKDASRAHWQAAGKRGTMEI